MGESCCRGEDRFLQHMYQRSDLEGIKKVPMEEMRKVSGRKVVGNWEPTQVEEQMKGQGFIYVPSQYYYEGEIVKGQAQGNGVMYTPSEYGYKGEFVDGRPHGRGQCMLKGGDVMAGKWQEGEFVKGQLIRNEKEVAYDVEAL